METAILDAVRVPELGQLVRARGRHWVVGDVSRGSLPIDNLDSAGGTQSLVTLTSVEDDRFDETTQVIWELEPGTRILDRATLVGAKNLIQDGELDLSLKRI